MEFSPSLVGCVISSGNHSFEMVRKSGECVINVPTTALTGQVIGIVNSGGAEIDKFDHFGPTADKAEKVKAPLIRECYANFECRLADDILVDKYNFFIWEVVRAQAAVQPFPVRDLSYIPPMPPSMMSQIPIMPMSSCSMIWQWNIAMPG